MRYEIPEQKKHLYETTFAIRWGDMDAMGHVNNASYFRYMESARIDWVHSVGAYPEAGARTQGILVANAFCNFYRPLAYPCEVLLRMYASNPGRTTFESWVTMAQREEPETICAAGGATIIWVDYAQQKATALPDWLRQLVQD